MCSDCAERQEPPTDYGCDGISWAELQREIALQDYAESVIQYRDPGDEDGKA